MSSGNIALSSKIDFIIFVQGKLIDNNIKELHGSGVREYFTISFVLYFGRLISQFKTFWSKKYTHARIPFFCLFKGKSQYRFFFSSNFQYLHSRRFELNNDIKKNMNMFYIKML